MSLYTISEQGKERLWAPIVFTLPADVENEIMEEQVERIQGEVWDDIEAAFPEFRLPTNKQPTREKRLAFLTAQTDEADYAFLKDPQYLKKYRAKQLPMLVSPFWADLMAMPPVFTYIQRDFTRLTSFIEDAE